MLISETITAYEIALDEFMASHDASDVPGIYHAVRQLAYFSDGERSPEAVIRTGRGACTAKHILLRDLLRRFGETADVELAAGDFAAAVPASASMPATLRNMIREKGIPDYHCYVVWQTEGNEIWLDATWPDALDAHGFPVNADWTGDDHTILAIWPNGVTRRAEDVITAKAQLLGSLSADQAATRQLFLKLLSDWIATVS